MSELKIRYLNNKDEFLVAITPLSWSKDISLAFTQNIDCDDVDYDWIVNNIITVLNSLVSKYGKTIFIEIYNDKDEAFYRISLDEHKVVGSINTTVDIDDELQECLRYISDVISSEYADIIIKTTAKDFLTKSIDDIKSSLGMKNVDLDESDIDELCNQISKETKAEIVKPTETLNDYVCNDLLREELLEIKDFFENRETYKSANVDIPKGILFKGPWGTGKTYAARCIAGSVDCYFMTCTASALQGMYIGSGAENIRNVFKGAKKLAELSKKGVIIFIDELDSFGDRGNRGAGASGEEDRTLNQLLAEMSGFTETTDVLVLAATNFPERLDSALMRSGRFGRQIAIDYPDSKERLSIIKYYFDKRKIKLDSRIPYETVADLTVGLTPADIKEISNEACILTIRNKESIININSLNEAINKVITKNIRHPDKDEDFIDLVTYHECGHVVAEMLYNNTIPIKVTNYSYGDAGGFTQPAEVLSGLITKQRLLNEVRMLLGGRAAEEVCCGYITSGASGDLKRAKDLLYSYYKYYNFETYETSKLDQIVLDKLNSEYDILVKEFKTTTMKELLNDLGKELKRKRVLYTVDLSPYKCRILGEFKI